MRQVVLDTETTGLRVEEGHRIIEIGCVELINRKLTGNTFQVYINPEREIEAGAVAVHGITNEKLRDQPLFAAIADDFMNFVTGAEVIIHNAPFDLSFLNNELVLTRQGWPMLSDHCQILDTLLVARQLHVGQRNSLDALCKRYGIDNSKREYHGALLDAHLLAHVYLAMTGGQGSFFDSLNEAKEAVAKKSRRSGAMPAEIHDLPVILAEQGELDEHAAYLAFLAKKGKVVWQ